MSAATAFPRDSVKMSNNVNAADQMYNNALTTEFFFDSTTFDTTSAITPSKNGDARRSQRPHSSLVATPLNRSAGGHVTMKPSPRILENKYLPKPVIASDKLHSSPALLSAGKGYSTPLSKRLATAAANNASTTTTSPSASLINASSDIKARLRQLAGSSPMTATATGGSCRSYSRHLTRTPASSSKDFLISAAAGSGSRSSTFTPNSAESLASRSRANQMQAELQLRDLEVHKLAAAAAQARNERDEQKMRADKLEAIAAATTARGGTTASSSPYGGGTSPTPSSSFYQRLSPQQGLSSFSRTPAPPSPSPPVAPNEAQEAVSELRREAETLRQQVEMAASELQGQRARADAAEERARYAEACAGAESSAYEANENELRSLCQHVGSLQNEVRRLATDLAIAEDRAGLAESSLAEERKKGGKPTNNSVHNSAVLTEVALTAQVRALATQLKVARSEAATLQQELSMLKVEVQGHAAVQQGTTASILSTNRELEAALAESSQNLEERCGELEQTRGAVARLASENAALHAALKERDERYAALEYRFNSTHNSEGSILRDTTAETQLMATQQELKAAKTRIADLEHAMSKNRSTKIDFSNTSSSTGPSPLRDIVGSLRSELEDRELRLAAAEEELATERRRANDLHRQVLDQAVEIDDMQRETTLVGDGILRKELEQARREAHAAAIELAELKQQQQVQNQNTADDLSATKTTAADGELIRKLREDLDSRESEVMALQGQLNMLRGVAGGGTVGGGGGGGGEENWLL
jgi:hypothetical protein